MGILATILCLATFQAPQQPAAETQPKTAAVARLVPRGVLAALVIDRPGSHADALARTPLWQLIAGAQDRLAGDLDPARAAGILAFANNEAMIQALRDASLALAWTGVSSEGQAGMIFAAEFATAADAERIAAQVRGALQGVQAENWDGVDVQAGNHGSTRIWVMLRERALVFGNDRSAVTGAHQPRSGATLADIGAFTAEFADPAAPPLMVAFGRPAEWASAMGRALPAHATRAAGVAVILGLDRMQNAVGSMRIADGKFVERARVNWPSPRKGLLASFFDSTHVPSPESARFVPPEAMAFALGSMNWGALLDQCLEVASEFQPGARQMMQQAIDAFRAQHGVDLRWDGIDQLAGRMVFAHWLDETGPQFSFWQGLRQSKNILDTLRPLAGAAGVTVEPFACAGKPALRVQTMLAPGLQPAAAVVDDHLVLASSPRALARAIEQAAETRTDSAIQAFLTGLPPGTTSVAWTRGGTPPAGTTITAVTRLAMTAQRSIVLSDERGVSIETRSDLGLFGALASAGPLGSAGAPATGGATGTGGAPRTPDEPPTPAVPADPQQAATLAAAEKVGNLADTTTLAALLKSTDPRVAARAAWLLGRNKTAAAVTELCNAGRTHPDAGVRLQVVAALDKLADPKAVPTMIDALRDDDAGIRTLAAVHLGKVRAKEATGPLLGLVAERGKDGGPGQPTDVVAALVSLCDLGAVEQLLPAAQAVQTTNQEVGTALTFLFQNCSPKLDKKQEAMLLVGVLDHPQTTLRRYAIERLCELRDPGTVASLQGRLAAETPALQPLLCATLAVLEGDNELPTDPIERLRANAALLLERATEQWNGLDQDQQLMAFGTGGLVVVLLLVLMMVRARARRRRRVEEMAMLTMPSSQEFADSMALPAGEEHEQYSGRQR